MRFVYDFDEDPGDGVSDTCSIYVVAMGLDAVHGIWNGARPLQMKEFEPDGGTHKHVLRWESYVGMVAAICVQGKVFTK